MKMKCRKSAVVGILLGMTFLLTGGAVLHAHWGGQRGQGGFKPEGHFALIRDHLIQQLDLDPSQKQEVEAMGQELTAKGRALHELRASTREEILSILKADTVDSERMERLTTQHREKINEAITLVGGRLTDFVSLLNPEQRQRLAKMIESHGECSLMH